MQFQLFGKAKGALNDSSKLETAARPQEIYANLVACLNFLIGNQVELITSSIEICFAPHGCS